MNNNKCWWTQLYTDDIGTILLDDRSQSDLNNQMQFICDAVNIPSKSRIFEQ